MNFLPRSVRTICIVSLLIATTVSAYALNTDPPNFSSLYKDHTIALKGGTHNLVLAEQAGVSAKLSANE
jgi:hypothetical protein